MSSNGYNPLDYVPSAKAPPGYTSNLIDPPSNAHAVQVLDAVLLPIMLIAVIIRFIVRVKLQKSWARDDGMVPTVLQFWDIKLILSIAACVLAVLGSIAHFILYTQMVKIGYGRHLWDIPASWLVNAENIRILSANGIAYPLTILFTKLSLLFLYQRIFGINRPTRVAIQFTVILITLFYVAMTCIGISSLVICTSLSQQGTKFCKAYSGPLVLVNAAFNVATDFVILALPFPPIKKLRLGFKQKLGLTIVFAAGLAACAASLARLVEFSHHYHSSDVFWIQSINALYTIVEINIGIIVACVSSFPPFYVRAKVYIHDTSSSLKRLMTLRASSDSEKSMPTTISAAIQGKQGGITEHPNEYLELQDAPRAGYSSDIPQNNPYRV